MQEFLYTTQLRFFAFDLHPSLEREKMEAEFEIINKEVNRERELYQQSKILYATDDGRCFIHDEIDRLESVEHEISKEEGREMEKDYVVYVNDGTPSILKRRKFLDRFYTETGMQELRDKARPLWDASSLVCADFQTIFQVAKGKVSFEAMMEYVICQLNDLKKKVKPVDLVAFIVFSLNSNYYTPGSWQEEEVEHLEAMFREMVEEGEQLMQEDLETAAVPLPHIFTAQWQ